jgi:hypothetical protein
LENIPADGIVSVIDFAENYSFEIQNEVQSMHWQNYQVSILVQIYWTRNPNLDLSDPSTNALMKYHFHISHDKKHDSYFVQHCLNLHWKDLHQSGFFPSNIGSGQMVVLHNSKVKFHGTMLVAIFT